MKTYLKALVLSILCMSSAYAEVPVVEASPSRWVAEVMAAPKTTASTSKAQASNPLSIQDSVKKMMTPN